ncbi:MAG: 50S ribosomal protein L4 [Bacteroidia bacterium]|nr:MAG: 50S ribosomal protein L4 [Bacteroidia bacterium]
MELSIYNIQGKDTGRKIELHDSIFGINPNEHSVYLDVKQYLANKRQGTHKAKERAEVHGSTKKIKKQKGTGTARAGSIKSPLFRGGGTVFGPRPRSYSFKLNKKVKQLARKSALSAKLKDKAITVLEDFSFEQARTKEIVSIVKNFNFEKKSLFVLSEPNKNVYLSARNLKSVKITTVSELTTYDVLNAQNLVLAESSIASINKVFNV